MESGRTMESVIAKATGSKRVRTSPPYGEEAGRTVMSHGGRSAEVTNGRDGQFVMKSRLLGSPIKRNVKREISPIGSIPPILVSAFSPHCLSVRSSSGRVTLFCLRVRSGDTSPLPCEFCFAVVTGVHRFLKQQA